MCLFMLQIAKYEVNLIIKFSIHICSCAVLSYLLMMPVFFNFWFFTIPTTTKLTLIDWERPGFPLATTGVSVFHI